MTMPGGLLAWQEIEHHLRSGTAPGVGRLGIVVADPTVAQTSTAPAACRLVDAALHRDGAWFIAFDETVDLDTVVARLAASGWRDSTVVAHEGAAALSRAAGRAEPCEWLIARRPRRPGTQPTGQAPLLMKAPSDAEVITYVVPVRDEAPRLEAFLMSLATSNGPPVGLRRRFAFIVNGCTDDSPDLIKRWCATRTDAVVLTSLPGIADAWVTGVHAAEPGLLGKLDADTQFDASLLLGLEQAVLDGAHLAYAEPCPLGAPTGYDHPDQDPAVVSQRLYYVAKACAMRSAVALEPAVEEAVLAVRSDDIVLSAVIALRHGLDAMVPTGCVRSATVASFDDLVIQIGRCRSALARLRTVMPWTSFALEVFDQKIISPEYAGLVDRATVFATEHADWTRLASTKLAPRTARVP